VVLILGDMLFDGLPGLPADRPVFMMEDWGLCTRVRHHKHKIVLFLSAMRHFRDRLRGQGRTVHYSELGSREDPGLAERLRAALRGHGELLTYEIADRPVRGRIAELCREEGARLVEAPNPMFLVGKEDWEEFLVNTRRVRMAEFYVHQRKRLRLLIDPDDRPIGGKWSFDAANRKRLPRGLVPPAVPHFAPDGTTREVVALVDESFPDHPGTAAGFCWPVTHEEAAAWLDDFLESRLDQFGDYEDALSSLHRTVYHSLLSPMLNTGLLTPAQVVAEALKRHERRPAPINSLEGFLRQVVGWREFVRGVHRLEPSEPPEGPFGHTRGLTAAWYEATTGLAPLDLAIRRCRDHGWIHHIERLMVVGAAMLMCEVRPRCAYDWFMEMTIDSADWVMGPNVYGMSQFAHEKPFTTKPYLSSSAYLKRMGADGGDWEEVWDGLFWRFVGKHRWLFESNPRTRPLVRTLDRMDPSRLQRLLAAAVGFVARTTVGPELSLGEQARVEARPLIQRAPATKGEAPSSSAAGPEARRR
jgi:deoxyribodipyrimidine photolyase-related protein